MHNALGIIMSHLERTVNRRVIAVGMNIINQTYGNYYNSLNDFVMQKIIREHVLPQCNLSGGRTKIIEIKSEWREQSVQEIKNVFSTENGYDIYRIPAEARDNCMLVDVMSLRLPYAGVQQTPTTYISANYSYSMAGAAMNMLNSYTMSTSPTQPRADVLDGDLIRIVPSQMTYYPWLATCRLAYNEHFDNLPASSVRTLCKLTEFALKALLYNLIMVDIDRSQMEFGADIGMIRTVLEEYRDAETSFEEQCVKFVGASQLDPDTQSFLDYAAL